MHCIHVSQADVLSIDEKTCLVQATVAIDTAEKKIKDLINKSEALKSRVTVKTHFEIVFAL